MVQEPERALEEMQGVRESEVRSVDVPLNICS